MLNTVVQARPITIGMKEELEEKVDNLPSAPGVYLFKDSAGEIVYVGKSANVRARVRSYFTGSSVNPVREKLREQIADVEAEETESEIAALVREAELIKKHKPRFNVLMRDSKNYVYVGFTQEDYPRIIVSHQPTNKLKRSVTNKLDWVGPFTDARAVKKTLRMLRTIFPHYTKRRHSRVAKQIGIVPPDDIDKKDYRKNVFAIKRILTGRSKKVQRQLKKDIQEAADNKQYEKAKKLHDVLEHLTAVFEHAHVLGAYVSAPPVFADTTPNWKMLGLQEAPERIEAYDISNIQGEEPTGSMVVFSPKKNGSYAPDKSQYRKFAIRDVEGANDPAMMREVLLRRLRHNEWQFPDLIVIDGGKPQLNAAYELTAEYDIPTIALAKKKPSSAKPPSRKATDGRGATAGKEERVYFPGRKEPVPAKRFGENTKKLLQAVRDETHRFALKYHKHRRNKATFEE